MILFFLSDHSTSNKMIVHYLFRKVARRAWCGNSYAQSTISRAMKDDEKLKVTVPFQVEDITALARAFGKLHKSDDF